MSIKKIIGDRSCGFANWLFWIFNKEHDFNIKDDIAIIKVTNETSKYLLKELCIKYIDDDKAGYFDGDYKQDFKLFDIPKLRKELVMPNKFKNEIYQNIPDIEERVCIHVRRGDYLTKHNSKIFISPSVEYISRVYNKYYAGEKILVISNDIEWCKENLSDLCDDIRFSDLSTLGDFFAQTLTKGNICSCSSFSMMGVYLNKNEDCVVPHPYYKKEDMYEQGEKIIPSWAKREDI